MGKMSEISVNINGRQYPITCEEGEEEHIVRLARYIDKRVKEFANTVGQIGEAHLLAMTSLYIADELYEANQRARIAGDEGASAAAEELVARLDRAAIAVKGVASQLEREQIGETSNPQDK